MTVYSNRYKLHYTSLTEQGTSEIMASTPYRVIYRPLTIDNIVGRKITVRASSKEEAKEKALVKLANSYPDIHPSRFNIVDVSIQVDMWFAC